MLKPLEQWICDTCGLVIESVEDGCVEWDSGEEFPAGFRLVHHEPAAPPGSSCYGTGGALSRSTLVNFMGANGLVVALSLVDRGPLEPAALHRGVTGKALRSWVTVVRRLFTPYFEEARMHMDKAAAAGEYTHATEVTPYVPYALKDLIERYSD